MYRALVVEDEPSEAQRLSDYLRRYGDAHGEAFHITYAGFLRLRRMPFCRRPTLMPR